MRHKAAIALRDNAKPSTEDIAQRLRVGHHLDTFSFQLVVMSQIGKSMRLENARLMVAILGTRSPCKYIKLTVASFCFGVMVRKALPQQMSNHK